MLSSQYNVKIYHSFSELPAHYSDYIANQAYLRFDQTLIWYTLFSQHILSKKQKPVLFCVEKAGKLCAFFPFYHSSRKILFKQEIRLSSMTNYFSAHFSPLVGELVDQALVLEKLVEAIKGSAWNVLDINPIVRQEKVYEQLNVEFHKQGLVVENYFRFANWCLDLEGRTYSEYLTSIPKNIQNTITRKYKKIQLLDEFRFEVVEDESTLQQAIGDFELVYSRRWSKGEVYHTFVRQLIKDYFQRGWLRFGLLYIGDRPIAAQVWFVCDGTAYIFKVAHDREYDSYSVGTILTALLIEHVIDNDNVKLIDYLCGDESYKKNWMNLRNEAWGIRIYREGYVFSTMRKIIKVIHKAVFGSRKNQVFSSEKVRLSENIRRTYV